MHLKAIDCFRVGTHHHAGVVDEDVKLVDLCRRGKTNVAAVMPVK